MSGTNSSVPESNADRDPVALTIHRAPLPEIEAERTKRGRRIALLVAFVCALPVIASYLAFYGLKLSGHAYGDLIVPTRELPALTLHDLQGHLVDPNSLKGQWLLAVAQPSSCDKACENQLFMQRQLREMLGKDKERVEKLWLIPDDAPLRSELQKAMEAQPPVTVLRVPRDQLQAWLQPAEGHVLQDHLYLVDPLGRWMLRFPVDPDPKKVKADLNRLMQANAGWDQAVR